MTFERPETNAMLAGAIIQSNPAGINLKNKDDQQKLFQTWSAAVNQIFYAPNLIFTLSLSRGTEFLPLSLGQNLLDSVWGPFFYGPLSPPPPGRF